MRKFIVSCLILAGAAGLASCSVYEAHQAAEVAARADEATNIYPPNYKSDILAVLRVYLIDPTNVRDAGVSEPFLQSVGGRNRYTVCVQLSARKSSGGYGPIKSHVAYFSAGRLDRLIEANQHQCDSAAYQAFSEAEKLSR
jgi:hypothetical protein